MLTIFIVGLCLFLNAILACAEMAFVTVDKRLLHKEAVGGDKKAKLIEDMQDSPERILSVVQIGITFVGAVSAAVSGAGAEESISPWLMSFFGISEKVSESLAIVMVVAPLTILSVVIGELVPKSFAIRYSLKISLFLAPGLGIAEKLLGFLVNPMEKVTNKIVGLLPGSSTDNPTEVGAEVSLQGLKDEHKTYIHNLIDLDFKIAEMAMVDWPDVRSVNAEASAAEVNELLLHSGHTRIPVISHGEVYGFLHLKEFLQMMRLGAGENWLSYIRPIIFISGQTKLLKALKLMRKNKVQILVVGTAAEPLGILTLEDVLEEVVGDIVDETEERRIFGFLRHRVYRDKNPRR